MGVVLFLTLAFSALYCLQQNTRETSKAPFNYDRLREVFRENRKIFELGLASAVVLLGLNVALYQIPNSRVRAAGFDMRLSRAIFSANPVDENTAQELTTIFRTATIDRVSINPRLVNVASKKVTAASQVSPSAWPAALALLDYRSGVVGKTPPPPYAQRSCFEGVRGVEQLTLVGCPGQVLDGIAWKNMAFQNSVILYHGGPLRLENVQFRNCQFVLDYNAESQELAKALATSDTVTITQPGR